MRYTNYAFTVPDEKVVRLIVNTDAKNEADDQFAVVHALLSPKFENIGFIAAHYGLDRHVDSMQRGYRELEIVFQKMQIPTTKMIYAGATRPMESEREVLASEGASLIIEEAMKDDARPLYVLFLGPLTDMASAYLQEPRIANRLTCIWIGGAKYPAGGPEYNLSNDIHAANVVFGSPIELWQIPQPAFEPVAVSLAELELKVYNQGEIGRYLFEQLNAHAQEAGARTSAYRSGESWVLGDSPAVGLLLHEHRFSYDWMRAPRFGLDMQYIHTDMQRPIRVYNNVDGRLILEDFFSKLALFAQKQSYR